MRNPGNSESHIIYHRMDCESEQSGFQSTYFRVNKCSLLIPCAEFRYHVLKVSSKPKKLLPKRCQFRRNVQANEEIDRGQIPYSGVHENHRNLQTLSDVIWILEIKNWRKSSFFTTFLTQNARFLAAKTTCRLNFATTTDPIWNFCTHTGDLQNHKNLRKLGNSIFLSLRKN